MILAVIDTNVLVSALWTNNPMAATKRVLDLLSAKAIVPLYSDEDDRVFYEISLTEEESFMVTGNLKHYPKVPKVVTPSEFLTIIGK